VWHAYKHLVKTVYRAYFPIFAVLENIDELHAAGTIIAQRKLLYLEKLFASILLGAPQLRAQLRTRVQQLRRLAPEQRGFQLKLLVALQDLLDFWMPAVFRMGYLTRTCTWDGRGSGSATIALEVLQEVLVMLVYLTADRGSDPYVRTISVALLSWRTWHSTLPACCFQEETCEAMLSRVGHRCDVHRNLHGFDATMDLYLTVPTGAVGDKNIRGKLRDGLVQVFAARIRRIVFDPASLPYAIPVSVDTMKTSFSSTWPADVNFPAKPDHNTDTAVFDAVLRKALLTLIGKKELGGGVEA
jgi:hypothetical protein